ncbi:MAG: tetratricopeptide repeat protein [Candidatus Omnitrophica bacterium]|nr:tetratricopeptide repeat protein [Candidatus Omnitrophota bacterium]
MPPKAVPGARQGGRRLLGWVGIVVAAFIGFGAGTWIARKQEGLYVQLADVKQRFQVLQQEHKKLTEKAGRSENDLASLQESHQSLREDRDRIAAEARATTENVKSQLSGLHEERQRLIFDTERLAQENKALSTKLGVVEQELSLAQKAAEKLTLQRDTIQKQLARSERRTAENQLREQLLQSQSQGQELKKALQESQKTARALEQKLAKTEAEAAKLSTRMKQVQDEYVKLVAEKKQLQKMAEAAPENVTRMAKQHEHLVKETADMHYNLGVLFSKQSDYAKASKEFQKVIELRPADADAHYNLGVIYAEHIPNRPRAMEYFRKYLKLNPDAKDVGWVKQYIATWQAWEGKERLE